MKIRSIQKGWGNESQWFRVGDKYSRIEKELKDVAWGNGRVSQVEVYRVYDAKGNIYAEVEPNSCLTIFYMHD